MVYRMKMIVACFFSLGVGFVLWCGPGGGWPGVRVGGGGSVCRVRPSGVYREPDGLALVFGKSIQTTSLGLLGGFGES